ncbi:18040_t:CDS:2 [Funneliformis geosporum]|nr:18040_t:CDS:2 [Funneliformis geosporum]
MDYNRKIVNHSGRSTYLTWLFQNGLTEKQIMDISGHKSLKALLVYIKPTLNQKSLSVKSLIDLALDTNKSTDIKESNNQAINNEDVGIIDLENVDELIKGNEDSTSEIIESASIDLNSMN